MRTKSASSGFLALATGLCLAGTMEVRAGTFATSPASDKAPPVLTEDPAVRSVSENVAIVTWRTDKPSDSRVYFGQALPLARTAGEIEYSIFHSVKLTNLVPETTYSYRVVSVDPMGNQLSGEIRTFTATTDSRAGQTIGPISFVPSTLTVGATTTASATATSGLGVAFSSLAGGVCAVSGSVVTGRAAGTCTVAADQAGNNAYDPAPRVTQDVLVVDAATPAGIPGSRCGPGTVVLSASGATAGHAYKWYEAPSGGTALQTGGASYTTPSLSTTTTFYVSMYDTATSYEGSRTGVTATINLPPAKPTVTPSGTVGVGSGSSVTLTASSGAGYLWSTGATTSSITVSTAGSYWVQVTGTNGCLSSTSDPTIVTGSSTPSATTRIYTVAPCRLFDTRNVSGADAASPALAAGATRTFTIGGRCSIPSSAKSLSVNQTVTGPTAAGELLLYRADLSSAPTASSLSFRAGVTRANNGMLELAHDGSGTFKVFNNSSGTVHLILDVNGYFQ